MKHSFQLTRSIGIVCLAMLACLLPAIGENRYLLAATLVFISLPLAIWVQNRYPVEEIGWSQPLYDLISIVVLVHLIPEAWHLALLVGGLLLGATGIVASHIGYRFYIWLIAILILGMSLAGYVHDVEGWVASILVVMVLIPSMLVYVHQEHSRLELLNEQSSALDNLALLAGGIAHDLNNMLTTIKGNSELALLNLPVNHASREAIATAIDGVNRASLLSGQLLAFSGRSLTEVSTIDLCSEIVTITNLIEHALPKGTVIEVDLCETPCLIECDQAQIEQVLMNLILNAGEAIVSPPSKIYISLRHESSAANLSQQIVLEIRDEGIGIPADRIGSVFEPFVSSKPMGHGLGLASAKRVLEEHQGDITIQSKEGEGTTVWLRFPAVQGPVPSSVGQALETKQEHTSTDFDLILVIDDEDQIRDVACRLLDVLGYKTLEAESGYEGIELYKQRRNEIRAVLLDLKMPGKDGWQCLDEIREISPDVPVVISSGYNPENKQPGRHNLAFLAKPYSLADMDQTFSTLLECESI
ncbi:MAG: response regulator [Pseudomonadales bacterium]|nr:response regulator [Pseudomonadales bacterium]